MKEKWRVFISYRGESTEKFSTKDFAGRLYSYLIGDPLHKEKFGDIYYSPETDIDGNFDRDVPEIMRTVEHFIMPLNDAYFADSQKRGSIIYKEITEAIKNECHFICIAMPGYTVDTELMEELFGDNANLISCAKKLVYDPGNELSLFREIEDLIILDDFGTISAAEYINQDTPNIFMSFKEIMESSDRYPFYPKLHDVKRMTLVNFASSAFISGIQIASIYEEADTLKRWFERHLAEGKIEIDIILTNPHSMAARDAALYKMNPPGQKIPTDKIILTNINRLFRFMKENPSAKINLYLTDAILPYGLMITEHKDKANNFMKVDLYAVDVEDDERPSFYLLKNNTATERLYSFFVNNARNIRRKHSYEWKGHPDVSWLLRIHIIHRAMIGPGYLPHTRRSVNACLSAGLPMEIDLLELKDHSIIIGREDQEISEYGIKNNLNECSAEDILAINKVNGSEKIMFLHEFLKLVGGRVPVLLEIKIHSSGELSSEKAEYVRNVMREVENYLERFLPQPMFAGDHGCHVAIHSANPKVLEIVREIDCTIPIGIISMDFTNTRGEDAKELRQIHGNSESIKSINPDFVSYNIQDLDNGIACEVCNDLRIPLIAWTIRNGDDQQLASSYQCDNIIIEGSNNYL